jgi:hypothetical protein
VGLKSNGTHHLLAYTGDVNLLGDKINATKKNTYTLIDAGRDIGLLAYAKKIKYVSSPECKKKMDDINIGQRSFQNVAQFIYLRTTVTKIKSNLEEIRRGLNSGKACYHSVQNLLPSRSLSQIIKDCTRLQMYLLFCMGAKLDLRR